MKLLIQRVNRCSMTAASGKSEEIGAGLLVLAGICKGDKPESIGRAAEKLISMRIFEDDDGKMNRNVIDINGSIMLVSQFTLCSDLKKGNRPSFDNSMEPTDAGHFFAELENELKKNITVKTGVFGDYMDVELVNSGPCTFILEL